MTAVPPPAFRWLARISPFFRNSPEASDKLVYSCVGRFRRRGPVVTHGKACRNHHQITGVEDSIFRIGAHHVADFMVNRSRVPDEEVEHVCCLHVV